ncbi:myb-like protein Q isoform X1 [Drosophila busckii]|uniref:myb-like protein Q isoform X1 n=1 Tax=Drosophila busckii TaxID=30019 RepID=UPI00083F4D81|nr:myb-like protein Q isoform X1 [Drosophila busckii]
MTGINSLWFYLLLCHSCNICGLHCLGQLAMALPFEYSDEHDDFNYDLDTAQSQAKYDARLLSEQMLSDAELLQQRAQNVDDADNNDDGDGSSSLHSKPTQAQLTITASGSDEDDLEPHSRAAACFTNGHKYTHGQKVPRSDACEVCLCMDGEIFCWWEKCDKTIVSPATTAAAAATSTSTAAAAAAAAAATANGDYSDPYRYETTTRKSTKLHKAARKVGKRHKHRKNQKTFNDYEVYHSRKQADYKKADIKQQKQKSSPISDSSSSNSGTGNSNYNIIKQHKHEQKLATSTLQQQPVEHMAATPVNQAAKETHYQPQQLPKQQQQQQPQHVQQLQQHPHQQQHAHQQQQHSTSKILNFPENLPALLYYDYKTEEHEHHQHQHHQQHLLHEKQRLLQQQKQQQQQQQQLLQKAKAVVELNTDLSADKNFDEAETDSDILPVPPTKRPQQVSTTGSSSSSKTTATTTTTIGQQAATVSAITNQLQHDQDIEQADDAFHRWLTSTELNVDSTNTLDDGLPAVAVEQEAPTSTIIDDVGSKGSTNNNNSSSSSNNIADNADAVFFRSSYNDYSSEFNGSVVNIDITLTAVDVHPHQQHAQQQQQQHQLPKAAQTDLIANDNRSADIDVADRQRQPTMDPKATAIASSITTTAAGAAVATTATPRVAGINSNQRSVPPYTLTTIITTTPLATRTMPTAAAAATTTTTASTMRRMCNVLGKLYKIGEILPQDTGNCLQCICTDAITPDELPSVTCSPHNCPPLVLPDLFDATGY